MLVLLRLPNLASPPMPLIKTQLPGAPTWSRGMCENFRGAGLFENARVGWESKEKKKRMEESWLDPCRWL